MTLNDWNPVVSIIVPTYNEEADICRTLDALVRLNYPHKEILVVDDSTDSTPTLVKRYEAKGVMLLHGNRQGRCAARNMGIEKASGEILIILNADVLLSPDFIDRILPHYRKGADYVLVESKVANDQYLFPRFVEALHHFSYDGQDWIEWTEGFSCRRRAALDVGMFPMDFPVPLVAGEDGFFGEKLSKKHKKVIDRSIVVYSIAPHTFRDYWRARKEKGSPLEKFFLRNVPLVKLAGWLCLKTVYIAGQILLAFPACIQSFRISRFSPNKIGDIIPFFYAYCVQQAAMLVGAWQGVMVLFRNIRNGRLTDYKVF